MHTALTDVLEIEHPVMLAGMGGVSYHALVAAVSEAGGFGCMGASTMSTERMIAEMELVRGLTAKPFGVDLLTAMPGDMPAQVQAIIDHGGRVFVAGLGVPRDVVRLCHDNNILIASMCGKVRHAVAAVAAGCDLVIAQGTEAGGHTGTVATMALVPQVVDAVEGRVPVVAAGGLFDGRGLAAALTLGAAGVWVGTRFIATPEAWGTPGYKERLVAMAEDDTVVTRAYTGKTCRVNRNAYTQAFEDAGGRADPFPAQFVKSMGDGANHLGLGPDTEVDPDIEFWPAGQAVGGIDGIEPAGDVVRRFVAEAEAVLDRVASLR
ncbi:MAG: nitronate monooxygenase [Acidimicrobiales bacterium]|jgi:enoyl-[acyl-carrier protein] reductase II|nr:nitronate monooxygenase [Acidimicrobiales bacterium]